MANRVLLALLVPATVVLTCCAGHTPTTSGPPAVAGPTTSASSRPEEPPTVTVQGVVRADALPGCFTLFADDGPKYLLLDSPHPPLNVPVEVSGAPDPATASYCNGGLPLHVAHISSR